MQEYLKLLKAIQSKGTYKPAARENMPGTQSLFGYQFRHNLKDGFPLLTTKKLSFKNIVVELLWFLKGDTNIKYLVDSGCNIWNEDAYNYYVKIAGKNTDSQANKIYFDNGDGTLRMFKYEEFVSIIKQAGLGDLKALYSYQDYVLGDCGEQYGKLWRSWKANEHEFVTEYVDQLRELLEGLRNNPMGRRHIISAWNPVTLNDMALNACHALVQFNCRPLSIEEKSSWIYDHNEDYNMNTCPQYYLDCQMYQRSADVFLGVPYNIATYSLLTHLICEVLNMVPGEFIHTFGDVHIYENHKEQVKEQLLREPRPLPKLNINTGFWNPEGVLGNNIEGFLKNLENENFLKCLIEEDIQLSSYNPHPLIKGELSTGLKTSK